MSYNQIAWLPLCAGLTAVGIALSFLAFRRRGAAAGLRATAWSLLPPAAYLTGALKTLWDIGAAAIGFVTGLVLSPTVWAGVVLAGLSVLLFLVSGAMRGRTLSKGRAARATRSASGGEAQGAVSKAPGFKAQGSTAHGSGASGSGAPAARETPAKPAAGGAADDFSDVEEILKRHGIN